MADKYWWEKDDKKTTTQSATNSNNQTEKKYWWEKDTTKSDSVSEDKSYWWENGGAAKAVSNTIVHRVNEWLKEYNSYITDYQNRTSGRKYNLEDSYVSDSADWLASATKRKNDSYAEAQSIMSYIEENKNYLDSGWAKDVRALLARAKIDQSNILKFYTKDNDWWNKFTPNEEQVAAGYTASKLYNEWQAEQKQYADDMAFDIEAGELELETLKNEKAEYLKAKEEERREAENNKSFWEKALDVLASVGSSHDTSLPIAGAGAYGGSTVATSGYDKLIAEQEAKITRAKYVQGYEDYMDYMNADDYATNSKYVSTRTDALLEDAYYSSFGGNTAVSTSTLFGDYTYDYINGHKDALGAATVNNVTLGATIGGFDETFLRTMKEEEIGVYNYLYKTQGKEAAEGFLKFIESDLTARRRQEEQQYYAAMAKESPILSSAFSVLISPLKAVTAIGQVGDYLDDGKIDQNAGYNKYSYIPSAIRGQVSSEIAKSGKWGEVGSWTYNLGMSMFDFLMNTAVSGGNSTLSLTLMGSGAMADTVISAKDRGLSDYQAMLLGVVAAGAEIVTEKFSLDALFKGGMEKGAMRYILTNAFTEGTEEVSSSLINTLADVLVSKDKSMWQQEIDAYLAKHPEATEEEAFQKVLGDSVLSLGLDFLGGSIMGGTMGAGGAGIKYLTNARPGLQVNKDAVNRYGGFVDDLIQEGLESDKKSDSYDLANYYQKKTAKGKTLTGYQIRSLLEANKKQIASEITPEAKARLKELGETKDIDNIASLVAKKVSGQQLTRAEISTLARSQYGAQVAKEMSGIESDAPKQETATYKSLEERVGTEAKFNVSDSGNATIHGTDNAISLDKVEVTEFIKDKETGKVTDMVLKVDGKEVKASEIDYADDSQSHLFSAVSQIENISPADAQAIIRDYDPASGLSVGEYLNGIDEGFTYGYHNYSEADLKAGNFAPKLGDVQSKSAYVLGQNASKNRDTNKTEAIVRMRTAVEAEVEKAKAEGKEAPKSKELTITVTNEKGETVTIDEADTTEGKQSGGIKVAQMLHKLGLGTNFRFFTSYLSETMKVKDKKTGKLVPARVFLDENGVEQLAPAGVYRMSDGTICIDLNAYNGRQLTLNALAHELTHFIQQWSTKKYKVLVDFLMQTYEDTGITMHQRVLREQARLKEIRGEEISYNEAYNEVVANAMMKMFDDGKLVERLTELKVQDKKLAQKLWEGFKEILNKFLGFYQSEKALFYDADDLMQMKDAFEQLQNMFAEALVEASENFQAAQTIGFEMDVETDSVAPAVMHSEQTWSESEYVQQRDKAAQEIAKAIGVSEKKAKDYIDSVNSIAKMIAEDRSRLDYFSSPGRSSFVDNAEYGGSFDFSTLCKKRRLLTGTFTAIQKALPNTALTADEILDIRNRMKEKGLEVSCGLCYVEGSRANMGQFAKEFLRLYKQYYPDAWQPNMTDVNTPDGIEWVRINHPECYEQYEYFWNHYGTLKDGDKNLFASQQKPKLYQLHTEYKGEILNKFKNDDKVEDKNLNGGIRLQSFSDFEIVHLIDTMQIIMDMSRVGLAGQAYTKVPDFAWALGDTGLKINLSLIAKGVDENGKLIFDDVEGMPIADAMKLRDRYSKNVGTILVAFNDAQLLAAMADDRVDFIIPFHRSQWKKSQYEAMGLPAKTKDYTFMQNEKFIKPTYHEYRGRMVKDKATNYMPNEYWDFSKSGKENAEAYLEMCARNNKRPKFYKLLQDNGDGSYSLKADGSTDGYWKLLIDFKMYDNDGIGSPQMAVKPEFNMEEATRMLNDYSGGHSNFPVAQGIVDEFVKDYKDSHKGQMYSSQETDVDIGGDTVYDGIEKEPVYELHKSRQDVRDFDRKLWVKKKVDAIQKYDLTEEETDCIDAYVGGEAYNWNKALLGDPSVERTEYIDYLVDQTINGLSKFPLFVGRTYRNLSFTDQNSLNSFLAKHKTGKNVVMEAFASASKDPNGYVVSGDYAVHMVIDGFSSKDISDSFAFPWQKEVIYLPETEIHITRVTTANDGYPLIYAKEVKKNGKDLETNRDGVREGSSESNQKGQAGYVEGKRDDLGRVYRDGRMDGNGDSRNARQIQQSGDSTRYGKVKGEVYSTQETDNISNRDLLSNAFEGLSQNSEEYKLIQRYKGRIKILNELEEKLSKLNAEILQIRFGKDGVKDTAKLRQLEAEAKNTAKLINAQDKKLLSLEASEPLRKLIEQERNAERQRSKEKTQKLRAELKLRSEVKQSEILRDVREARAALRNQKNDTAIMEKEFIRIARAYERLEAKTEAKAEKDADKIAGLEAALKDEVKKHRDDQKIWETEFKRLIREYEAADRSIDKLEAKIERQKANAKAKIENRNKAELRVKIRKTIRDLDKILNRGNKKQNVKEDMQVVVSKALKAADILFTDNFNTYDMLRNGLGVDLSDSEEALVKTCTQMLKDLDKMPTDGYENWQAYQEAESKLKTKMSKLNEVFARERKRLNNTTVSSILGELADAYASLENSEQSYVQGAYTEAVHNFLKNLQQEVGGTIVKDMTKDQLESVYAAYKMVLNTVRNANKMFNAELKQSREQLGNAVIEEVIKAGGVHLLGTKMGDKISQFDWNNMKPIWLANRIGSETFGKLMNGLFKGQYDFAVDIDEVKQFKLSMDEKYHPREWDAEKLYEFESSTGKKFSLNLQQIMSLYAFSKREQAHSHLLNGGFAFEKNSTVVVDGKLGIKRTYIHKGATSYKLNEATLNGIINSLTTEQKAYVDEMQAYLSDVMGAKGNEVSMKLYGIQMYKEKFYFPLRSSGDFMEKAKAVQLQKKQGQINLVNSGFTHSVKPEAKNPIILSGFLDVWAEHCNEMSMYHSMVLPMEDFRKVYNYTTIHDENMESASVQQAIIDAYGEVATKYIDQLYSELNAGATVDPRETPWKNLISNFKKTAVMLSGSVVVQQFSAIGRAFAEIDPKYFIGKKVNSGTDLSAVDEMKKYAPVAIIKEMGGFDTGTKGNAKAYITAEKYGKGERIKGLLTDKQYRGDIMGYAPAKADQLTWCAIWESVKRETKAKNPDMDVKSDAFLNLAGERFSEIVEKTQVYDSVLARSANMRSKGNFMAMATAFMAEPTTTINLIEDALRRGNKKYLARTFGAVAVSIVLNNALASLVYAMRDDDEDETFLEKYFQSFTSGMIDDINPMTYYPFLKDVWSMFQGYDVERTDMSVIGDLRDSIKKAISIFGKDTSGMDDKQLAEHWRTVNEAMMGILDAGCSMFGVPIKNVRREAKGIINAWNTISKDVSGERNTTWLSFWDKVGSATKDTIPFYAYTKDESKSDKLYRVIVSGDKDYLARLKSGYKDEDAYTSAVRKALRENDSRIHDAAQARYEGKTEEYKRIFKEIQNEGHFSFDDIMEAINSEESKIRNGEKSDTVSSDYSAKDFVNAIIVGENSNANAIRENIISTKVANGMTRKDAEKSFYSSVSSSTRDAFDTGLLNEAGAKKMLMEYADMDEEDATSRADYWALAKANPKYREDLSEARVKKFREFAEPANISMDVFIQFAKGTAGLETIKDEWGDEIKSVREQKLEVIDSLPLTWQQKDALYLAADLPESKIWDVPW